MRLYWGHGSYNEEIKRAIKRMKRTSLVPRQIFRQSALVVIDIQNDFCAPNGLAARYAESPAALERAVTNSASLIEYARLVGIPCIFVRSLMDNKYKLPKMLDRHRKLGIKQQICREGKWGADFYRVHPTSNECVITKHTNDAFLYTFLEPLLRKRQARTVIICGFYTEICVEDTVRSALQRGFHVVIPEECTAGLSLTCMKVSLLNMNALQASVIPLQSLVSFNVNGAPVDSAKRFAGPELPFKVQGELRPVDLSSEGASSSQ
jgi:nicotinamidase-related amidase